MKQFICLLTILLCFCLCSCAGTQSPQAETNDGTKINDNSLPESGSSPLTPEQDDEANEITLPSQWGSAELPDDIFENPATKPASTQPPADDPSDEPEEPVITTAPTGENDDGSITLPEDTFD